MQNTYWNNNGTYQSTADKLQELIPVEGDIKGASNKALEKFRKAVNCYYDLYNNGLCNRARSFAAVYGISASIYGSYGRGYSPALYRKVEERLNEIIEAAAAEQGIGLTTQKELFA
jgi:hypothetical protein